MISFNSQAIQKLQTQDKFPSQNEFTLNNINFSSNFESGNLLTVTEHVEDKNMY